MKILLGITGSIAAYKTPELLRQLLEAGHEVKIALTDRAKAFVSPLTLRTLLPDKVFDTLLEPTMQHIELSKWAEILLVAPTSANTLAKLVHGAANDLVSTIYLATRAKILIAPAMNQNMWMHEATQANVNILKNRGIQFLGPAEGMQACGDVGSGRMLEPEEIVRRISEMSKSFSPVSKILQNRNILITAGATQEDIDPVRYISNKSSGKMGYALAEAALEMGACVTLITGQTHLPCPPCEKIIKIKSAAEMYQAVMANLRGQDILIAAAAVADYTIKTETQKIKKTDQFLTLTFIPTLDIVAEVCKHSNKPYVVCFAAETEHILENAQQKLIRKGADIIIANDVSRADIGFNQDENEVLIVSGNTNKILKKNTKHMLARQIMEELAQSYARAKTYKNIPPFSSKL